MLPIRDSFLASASKAAEAPRGTIPKEGLSRTPMPPQDQSVPELALESATLRRLYGDWEKRRGERTMPARADFDVIDFKYMLGNLNLLDVLREPLRFRFRVHASNAVARLGYDLAGAALSARRRRAHAGARAASRARRARLSRPCR